MACELAALLLCLQAEFTPFTPGANDNASGVGVCLALAEDLHIRPLQQTEVWFAFTDCEETGCDGMKHFLNDHGAELGENAVYLILDEVGNSSILYLSADGLIVKHPTHPKAIELIQAARKSLPGISIESKVGQAYTDALVATKFDRIALTLVSVPGDPDEVGHWHQMSDTVDHLDPHSLENALVIARQLLNDIDQQVIAV
jgi:Zn-dependent M28 family amino/carboxypeptidase